MLIERENVAIKFLFSVFSPEQWPERPPPRLMTYLGLTLLISSAGRSGRAPPAGGRRCLQSDYPGSVYSNEVRQARPGQARSFIILTIGPPTSPPSNNLDLTQGKVCVEGVRVEGQISAMSQPRTPLALGLAWRTRGLSFSPTSPSPPGSAPFGPWWSSHTARSLEAGEGGGRAAVTTGLAQLISALIYSL